nr:peptidase S8 [Aetokthonos hydrillicola CCALA 1050]
SIPGISIGSVKLQSGITVPRIVPTIRGMYSWSTTALIRSVLGERPADAVAQQDYDNGAEGIQNFLDRIYYELRNLGKTPQERAINYAATDAFQLAQVFQQAASENMQLDTIEVEKSPLCRPESECWDVKLAFFDPQRQNQRARKVYRFTVDVSDEVPVTIGRLRSWSMF